MVKQEEVEKAALVFATQMINFDTSGSDVVVDDKISEAAMRLAIDWAKHKEVRTKMFNQAFPDWIDLAERDVDSLNLEPEKYYWFEGRQTGSVDFTVVRAKFERSMIARIPSGPKRLKGESGRLVLVRDEYDNEYLAQHVILEEGESIYTKDYKPELPEVVKAQIKSN